MTSSPWRRRSLLVAVAITLYLAGIGTRWRVFPDSAKYLLLADSLSQGTGYAIHGYPHGKYPPGFPAYLAVMQHLGMGGMLWLNALMTGMALATLWCGYRLLCEVTTRSSALAVMLVVALSYEMYQLSGAQLSDIPFMLLVTAGLWSLTRTVRHGRGWLEMGALALLASCWVRILGIPLAVGAAVGLIANCRVANHRLDRRRIVLNGIAIVAGAALTGLWLLQRDRAVQAASSATSYAAELSVLSDGSPVEWLWQPLLNVYFGGRSLARLLTGQYLPSALALVLLWLPIGVGAYQSARRRQLILLFAMAGYLAAIFLLRVPLARYLLPIAPGLILFLGVGFRRLGLRMAHRPAARIALVVAMVLLVVPNLPKDLRLVYRTHHPRSLQLQTPASVMAAASFLQNAARRDCPSDPSTAGSTSPSHDGASLQQVAQITGPASRSVCFVSDKQVAILSYMTGVPYLPIGTDLARHPPVATELRTYFEHAGVDYIVLWPIAKRPTRFGAALRRAIESWPDCQLVYTRRDLEIFAFPRRTPPLRTCHKTAERMPPHRESGIKDQVLGHILKLLSLSPRHSVSPRGPLIQGQAMP